MTAGASMALQRLAFLETLLSIVDGHHERWRCHRHHLTIYSSLFLSRCRLRWLEISGAVYQSPDERTLGHRALPDGIRGGGRGERIRWLLLDLLSCQTLEDRSLFFYSTPVQLSL